MREDSAGVIDVEAVNGRADFRGYKGAANIRQRGPSQYVATLGEGDNPVSLRASNGNIRVVITDNPVPVGYFKTHTFMFTKNAVGRALIADRDRQVQPARRARG